MIKDKKQHVMTFGKYGMGMSYFTLSLPNPIYLTKEVKPK